MIKSGLFHRLWRTLNQFTIKVYFFMCSYYWTENTNTTRRKSVNVITKNCFKLQHLFWISKSMNPWVCSSEVMVWLSGFVCVGLHCFVALQWYLLFENVIYKLNNLTDLPNIFSSLLFGDSSRDLHMIFSSSDGWSLRLIFWKSIFVILTSSHTL